MTQQESQPQQGMFHLSDAAVGRVHTALRHLRAGLVEPDVPSTDLVKPVLDLWAAAYEVHPWVARPVEHFLSSLSARRSVPSPEITSLAEDVGLLLLEVLSLTGSELPF